MKISEKKKWIAGFFNSAKENCKNDRENDHASFTQINEYQNLGELLCNVHRVFFAARTWRQQQQQQQFNNVNAWDGVAPHIWARGSCIKRMTKKKHEIQNLQWLKQYF